VLVPLDAEIMVKLEQPVHGGVTLLARAPQSEASAEMETEQGAS